MNDKTVDILENAILNPSQKAEGEFFRNYRDILYDDQHYDFKEIYPKVFIYKNIFSDPKKIVSLMESSTNNPDSSFYFHDWKQWGGFDNDTVFGQYVQMIGTGFDNKSIETPEDLKIAQEELKALSEVIKGFFSVTNHYMKYWGITKGNNWVHTPPSFCRYIPNERLNGQLFMPFHTDYMIEKAEEPGDKFAITTTMYLNDDYEGGEIIFKIQEEVFSYKPIAGDVLVFPSGHPSILMEGENPIMHAVKPVWPGNPDRYIVRMFHQIPSQGDNVKQIIKDNILKGEKVEK